MLAALKPVASMQPERFPVHQAILFALTRLGSKNCTECVDKLTSRSSATRRRCASRAPRDLLGETRVALAVIQNKS